MSNTFNARNTCLLGRLVEASLPVLTGRSAIYHLQGNLYPFLFYSQAEQICFWSLYALYTYITDDSSNISQIQMCRHIYRDKKTKTKGKKLKSLSLPQINKKLNKKPTKRPKVKPPKSKLTHSVALSYHCLE